MIESRADGKTIEIIMKKNIVIGIPSYNEKDSISYVVRQVDLGLNKFYNKEDCLIVDIDSDSEDGTKETFLQTKTGCTKKYLNGGKNPRGKGKNLIKLFQFCQDLDAKYIATIDGDVKTVEPNWPFLLLKPLITNNFDYTVPIYSRNRFDGNVTNHFVYPLVYSVYGIELRQPIGGEFGLSRRLYKHLLKQPINEATLEYGIDIFMTCHAIGGGFNISEASLGRKIHKPGFAGLMYKFFQIARSGIEVTRLHKQTTITARPIKKCVSTDGIDKVKKQPDKEKAYVQLNRFGKEFKRNQALYDDYLGGLTSKIASIMESGRPTLSADVWTTALSSFLAICYKKDFDAHLIPNIVELIGPIFFWRVISFWEEVELMEPNEAEFSIRQQAKLLKKKLDNLLSSGRII